MSVSELLREIQALPETERLQLVERLVQLTEADIPESLRQGMTEASGGEFLELDDVVTGFGRP